MKKIYKTLCAVFGFLFFAWGAEASAASGRAPRVDFRPDGLYLQNITVEDLKDYYQIYRYNDYIYMPGWIYPPVFLNELPSDYAALKDKTARNRLFIQILAPLTLKLAEELREERFLILETEAFFEKNGAFTPEQEALLESKAKKYDIFTRMKGQRRYELLLKHLLLKVDVVPPSILIARRGYRHGLGNFPSGSKGKQPVQTAGLVHGQGPCSRRRERRQQLPVRNFSVALRINKSLRPENKQRRQLRTHALPAGRNKEPRAACSWTHTGPCDDF